MTNTNQPANHLTLLLGGTGKTGRRIADRLAARGQPVRIGSRRGTPAFDWDRPDSWDAALAGATRLYIAYPPDLSAPEAAGRIAALLRKARVERVVLLSGRGEPGTLPAEQAVRDSGIPFTILRCAWFCQNFSESYLCDPVLGGEIAFPAGDCPEPFVDADDIAEVAAVALTEDGHAGQLYELTGPRLITFGEIARILGGITGRPIAYRAVSAAAYAAVLAPHVGAETAAALSEMFAHLLDGHNAHTSGDVARVLGRPARDFTDYARDAAPIWRSIQAAG